MMEGGKEVQDESLILIRSLWRGRGDVVPFIYHIAIIGPILCRNQ